MKNLSVLEIVDKIKTKQLTCEKLTQYYLNNIIKYKHKNAVLEVFDDALQRAREIDKLVESGEELPPLVGVPMLLKDNIMYEGKICSSASKLLENYRAHYNATVVDRLLNAGVVILGRTNMDEFAMGGSCENSAFGPCRNAYNDDRVSGGSSGGSAVAVALDMCAFALGSDTGGSVRQPSSYNGTVGLKPTNSRVSRYGLMAFAGTLDTIGVISRDVKDNAYVMSIIAGEDKNDSSSASVPVDNYLENIKGDIRGKRIAVIRQVQELVEKTEQADLFKEILQFCESNGAVVSTVELPEYENVLPVYYTIAPAEASSNMNRFDGIRFAGVEGETVKDIVRNTRSTLLGKEVKRRIMLGNFVLSSGNKSAYYVKAKKVAEKIRNGFLNILENNDLIFMPTTYGEAFEIGSKTSDPVSMYIEDMFTVTANIVGLPAISIPIGVGGSGLPLGFQILSRPFGESEIYNMADFLMTRKEVK